MDFGVFNVRTRSFSRMRMHRRERFREGEGFQRFKGTDRESMADRNRELVLLGWGLLGERALTTEVSAGRWYAKQSDICRRTELPRRGIQVKKV